MQRNDGFTLIELLVTIAIIALLAGIAVPQYSNYITRSRIPEATTALGDARVRFEQHFQDNRAYNAAGITGTNATTGCPNAVTPAGTTFQFFTVTCSNMGANTFTVSATGTGPMAGFVFTVNEAGTRATTGVPAGWTANANCWVTKRGGAC